MVAVSSFAALGNAQESAPASPATTAFGTQGNVAHNRTLHESELKRAAAQERQNKELMAAMAAQSAVQKPVYTTAEQFLAANKPPALPPGERPAPVRGSNYVPQFQNTAPVSHGAPGADYSVPASGNVPTYGSPQPQPEPKKGGLFGWLKPKKSEADFVPSGPSGHADPYEGAVPPSGAPGTPVMDAPAPEIPDVEAAPPGEIAYEGVEMPEVGNANKGIFGRIFGGKKEEAPAPVSTEAPAELPGSDAGGLAMNTEAPVPADGGGIPEAPAFDGEPAPVPEPAPAAESPAPASSIFVKRSSTPQSGQSASVKREENATVNGVYVKLYEGTRVTVLDTSGGQARIQLPDGRVGTISRGALQM